MDNHSTSGSKQSAFGRHTQLASTRLLAYNDRMALKRPLADIVSSHTRTGTAPARTTNPFSRTAAQPNGAGFGAQRAEQLQTRLGTALRERRTLAGAQAAAGEPVTSTIERRGDMVARKIDRLMNELKDEQR